MTDHPQVRRDAWMICPECQERTERIWDGICPACHYTLNGGDRAPDEALIPAWEASLSHG